MPLVQATNPDIVAPRDRLAYHHAQSLALPCDLTPLEAWNAMMARPLPLLGLAFRLRDAISARFGVKRIGGFSQSARASVRLGGKLDFFTVERNDPEALTLTERDRHLDVMIAVTTRNRLLTITASVVTHNGFGRIYMLPVGPVHRLIVWLLLRRLAQELAAEGHAAL